MVSLIATKIEMAFGANLTADPATWTWTDVSTFALGSVSVTAGRADEASQTQPTRCTFRLANGDARFTPRFPTSPYYPFVRRQTPVRVSLNPGTGYNQRFQGYIDSITPVWPSGNSTVAQVTVIASGSLRRLGQGTTPLRSALYRAISVSSPTVYWPLEEGSQATQAAAVTPGVPPLGVTGQVNFGSGAVTIPGSATAVDLRGGSGTGALLTASISPAPFSTSSWQVELAFCYATAGGTGVTPVGITTDTGTFIAVNTQAKNDGQPHHVALQVSQSGPDTKYDRYYDGVFDTTITIPATTMGRPASVALGSTVDQGNNMPLLTHFVLFTSLSSPVVRASAVTGYSGETATARLTRLCGEQSVPITVTGTSTTLMGPQRVATFISLIRDCETADVGILYDGAGAGLSYLARPSRYNQSVTLALDCNRYQVKLPFAPVEDDQRVRNDWTISRPNGSSGRFTNSAHIAANGLYDSSATHNVQADSMLVDQASWLVNLGTVEDMRLPTLTFDPLHSPELQTQWLATALGQRVTATNLPTQYPYSSTDQIVEGYTETWDSVTWSVTPNLSPYRPWEVFTIQDARLGRIETDGSTLNSSTTTSGTSLSVASAGVVWDTAAAPFDIEIEAEQITVTAVTGSSSPQSATVIRSVNGVVKAHNAGAVVKLWKPGVIAL